MSTEVFWQLRADVKSGRTDELRALMGELVESTTGEPGTQLYRWFADDGDTEVHIFEHYEDSAAALAHCATFGERYAERFLACVDVTGFDVYGEPEDAVREAVAGFGPTYHRPWGGFTRFPS